MDIWEGELEHTRIDGRRCIVSSRWSLSRDDAGQPIVMETNNDITERKRREGEVRKLNQELAQRAAELDASNKELERSPIPFPTTCARRFATWRHTPSFCRSRSPRRLMIRAADTCKPFSMRRKEWAPHRRSAGIFQNRASRGAKDQGEP